MAKHRGSGEGSIYQAKDGRWRGEISLGFKPDGKAHRKIVYGKTRVEVASSLSRLLRDKDKGIPIDTNKQTLEQLYGLVKKHCQAKLQSGDLLHLRIPPPSSHRARSWPYPAAEAQPAKASRLPQRVTPQRAECSHD